MNMQIETTRFGVVTIEDDQIITFSRGLVGLSDCVRFVLLQPDGPGRFYWLQSTDLAEMAFLVTDPNEFFKDYHVSIREETQQDLDLTDATSGRMLVICNRAGEWLTGNLLGPLVINTRTRVAQQVVLTDKKWTCRQPLVRLSGAKPEPAQIARAA
jgi:flagellar assembly factor FliW